MKNKAVRLFSLAVGVGGICCLLLIVRPCSPNSVPIGTASYGDTQFRKSMSSDPFGSNTVLDRAAYWTSEPWTGNDSLYEKARQEIEASNIGSKAIVAKYETEAESQPKSTIAQFKWGYALRKSHADSPATGKGGEDASAVFYSLTQAGDPHTYNYARLRYLVSMRSRFLANLGERFLKHSPEDNPVKLHLIGDYAFDVGESGNPRSKARALALCQQLSDVGFKRSSYYACLSMVYEMSYTFRHNPIDAKANIAANQKYISLVDPRSEAAHRARSAIAEVKADLAQDNH